MTVMQTTKSKKQKDFSTSYHIVKGNGSAAMKDNLFAFAKGKSYNPLLIRYVQRTLNYMELNTKEAKTIVLGMFIVVAENAFQTQNVAAIN
ncbi:hypothetical protein FGO68_gene11175 [Halteria grandinella]|uniref:Uncharacterized protein n=1 Tax=Halteria grandinella TaxID=5974 RepID=A0A8J8NH83_HALGN|nr:hypothetical protein FGO68_gene11175 [Halteria grandinella]